MTKHATKSQEARPQDPAQRPERDPISPFGHDMLSLYAGPMSEVRFPDLDRSVLEESAEACFRVQLEVEATERALEEARVAARDASVAFAQMAQRALAYARVFASGQPELEVVLARSATLATGSATGGAVAEPMKKKRGRPPKDRSVAPLLPMGESAPREVEAETDDVLAAE